MIVNLLSNCVNFVVMVLLFVKRLVPNGFAGITLYPFVILRNEKMRNNRVLINHERIHLKQQIEMFIIPFFIWYGLEFLIRLIIENDKHKAYRNISFEREAYTNDKNLNYLQDRKCWNFLKYLK